MGMQENRNGGEAIEGIIAAYPSEQRFALALLQDIQSACGFIPAEAMQAAAAHLGCSLASLYAMATFYKALSLEPKGRHVIKLCDGTACHLHRSNELIPVIERLLGIVPGEVTPDGLFSLELVSCPGFCAQAPVVLVDDELYTQVDAGKLAALLAIYQDQDGEETAHVHPVSSPAAGPASTTGNDGPLPGSQNMVVLRDFGAPALETVDGYRAVGGYAGLERALQMTPEDIIAEIEASGLRGRGGAGFPVGRKWRSAAAAAGTNGAKAGAATAEADVRAVAAESEVGAATAEPAMPTGASAERTATAIKVAAATDVPVYVICNADEGDPGAFMDRAILEGNPHAVIEGMAICALAVGAEEGILYIRDEYGPAIERVAHALEEAEEAGYIGESILGGDRRLVLSIVRGGGAYICGESTALMSSIEGKVGEPRAKYVRSVRCGLWGCPTVLNNVESLANIPFILTQGAAAFAAIGTEGSTGTKVFSLVGKVRHAGLVEVPMGCTLRSLLYDIGGGVAEGRTLKAVQTGGPGGGCIPAHLIDLPLDYDALAAEGAMMGSGGVCVMDDTDCMVEIARYYIGFLCGESCGKCTPCREGLRQMHAILTDICEGRGKSGDIEFLERIATTMQDASLCSLGKNAPTTVLTTIRFFRDEYEAHIGEGRCPAALCSMGDAVANKGGAL